jgi:hypothetical protein
LVDGEFAGAVNREREICATLAPALRKRGLLFVGIDASTAISPRSTDVADGHLRDCAVGRFGRGGEDLGFDRGEAEREII